MSRAPHVAPVLAALLAIALVLATAPYAHAQCAM